MNIGSYAMLTQVEAIQALDAAVKAYQHGRGVWPRCGTKDRIAAMEKFVVGLKSMRNTIVDLLM